MKWLLCSMVLYAVAAVGQTQTEMNKDACAKYRMADAEMNKAYRQS